MRHLQGLKVRAREIRSGKEACRYAIRSKGKCRSIEHLFFAFSAYIQYLHNREGLITQDCLCMEESTRGVTIFPLCTWLLFCCCDKIWWPRQSSPMCHTGLPVLTNLTEIFSHWISSSKMALAYVKLTGKIKSKIEQVAPFWLDIWTYYYSTLILFLSSTRSHLNTNISIWNTFHEFCGL